MLGFLSYSPMSGYDIKKMVEASIDNFWKESFGQIYPILKKLDEQGLVEKTADATSGGRARNVYAITDKGREALSRWLGEETEPPRIRHELLLKLFFGRRVDHATVRRQIQAYREHLERDLAHYGEIYEQLIADCPDEPELPYWLMTLRYGQRERAAMIEWCDETIETLESLPEPEAKATVGRG